MSYWKSEQLGSSHVHGSRACCLQSGDSLSIPTSATRSEPKRLSEEMSYPLGPSWRALKAKCRRAVLPSLQ